jgi:hypothetical protein
MLTGMLRWCLVAIVTACSSTPSTQREGGSGTSDACSPAGIGQPAAKPLAHWKAPDGCKVQQASGTRLIATEADARAVVECAAGVSLGIDFGKQRLLISDRSLSPATVGFDAVDDGKRITFVGKQRPNCPGDPQPMPMAVSVTFLVEDAGDRTFAEAACTLERKCP